MSSRYSWPVKVACGSVLVLVLLVCYPDSWGSKADAKSTGTRSGRDLVVGALFRWDVDGKPMGMFDSCVGIGSANEIIETKSGDKQGVALVQRIPGRPRWHDITLSRGLSKDAALWAWRQQVVDGRVSDARKNCTITMMSTEGQAVAAWELTNVWPSDLTMNAKGGADIVVEEITITPERVIRKQ